MHIFVRKNYINILSLITIFLFICTISTKIFAAEHNIQDEYSKGLINEKYKEQSNFTCNNQEFQIPPYFPFGDNFSYNNKPPTPDLYLTAQENNCDVNHFNIILGLNPDCRGQNICIEGNFEYRKFGNVEIGYMEEVLSAYKADVDLAKGIKGYFIPSRCFASCNTAKLIWFDYNKQLIFIISTKNDNSKKTISELVKAANSYINLSN